jgi:hypothetical protein
LFVGFAGIFSLRVGAKLDRERSNWVARTVRSAVVLKKFSFLLRRVHLFSTSWGIFIYLLLTKLHVVKVEMLLFRLCAKDRADFLRQGQDEFSAPTHNQ